MATTWSRWISTGLTTITVLLSSYYFLWSPRGSVFSPDVVSSATKKKGGGGGSSRSGSGGSSKTPVDSAKLAKSAYEKGMAEFKAGQLVAARHDLGDAMDPPGDLPESLAAKARETMAEIADKTIFSTEITPNDPYVVKYTTTSTDSVAKMMSKASAAYETTPQFMLKTNNLEANGTLAKSQVIKFVRGPFAALVNKKDQYLDLYLFPANLDPVFLKRVQIAIATDKAVPTGHWKIDKKLEKAPWIAPGSRKGVPFGDPTYPLDANGHWMNLATNSPCAIHSTKDGSLTATEGYVVLKQKDFDELYGLFLEKSSSLYIIQQINIAKK